MCHGAQGALKLDYFNSVIQLVGCRYLFIIPVNLYITHMVIKIATYQEIKSLYTTTARTLIDIPDEVVKK